MHEIKIKPSELSADSIQINFLKFKLAFDEYQNQLKSNTSVFNLSCINYQLKWRVRISPGFGKNRGIETYSSHLCNDLKVFAKINQETDNQEYQSFLWQYGYQYIGNKYAIVHGFQLTGSINQEIYYYELIE